MVAKKSSMATRVSFSERGDFANLGRGIRGIDEKDADCSSVDDGIRGGAGDLDQSSGISLGGGGSLRPLS